MAIFLSPRNRVDKLYSQALGSLFVASYHSQGYGRGSLPFLFLEIIYIQLWGCLGKPALSIFTVLKIAV
jgi:hypothetical protein